MLRRKSISGVIDPVSLIGVLFLIITLSVGTHVVADKKYDFNIFEQAAKSKKTGNSAFDKCREESGREVCNERLGTNINWKGEIVEKIDTSKVDKNVTKPGDPTCDANGTQYSSGAVVVYGGIDSYATCGADGKWNVGVGTITQIKPENVPTYAKETYDDAKAKEEADDAKATIQLTEQVAVPTTVTVEPEQIGLTQSTNQTSGTTVTQTQVVQQPTVTTVTTPVSPFAGVTIGVTGKTIPQVQQTYNPT